MLLSQPNTLKHLRILTTAIVLCGCATTAPVRHLSSDVCLVLPESTTKIEVQAFLGEPDQKTTNNGLTETWIYYKKNEDFLRKLPLVGERFGSLNYEVVTISFTGELVKACVYRQLEPGEITNSTDAIQFILTE